MGTLNEFANNPDNKVAGPGKLWVCGACGRMSKDKYGELKLNGGWDESCMLNSNLYWIAYLNIRGGLVISIEEGGAVPNEDKK